MRPVQKKLARQVQAKVQQAWALHQAGRLAEAQEIYQEILKLQPKHFDSLHLSGVLAKQTGKPELAIKLIDTAIKVIPDSFSAYNNRGNALRDLKRLGEALTSYDKALSLKPDYAHAYNNRGNALRDLKRLGEALASYDKALSLKPDYAEAYNNRGNVLSDIKRLDEALASYDKALSLKPDFEFLFGMYLHTRMRVCDWESLTDNLNQCAIGISESRRFIRPFPALGLLDAPELHKTAARVYCESKFPESQALGPLTKRAPNGKIRVGYYSADFHDHPMAFLTAELFEEHDTEKFEFYGFSFGPDRKDDMRERVSSAFGRFFDVRFKSDREVAQLSRDLGIDIAVDLNGYTKNARTRIFAERCAPVQVNYLGYPGTMAAEYIDYVIADKTVIPEDSQSDFTEKVAYLPYSYQAQDSKKKISDKLLTRKELGLPESGFVFCCFNNNYKILPVTFDGWMRILKAVEGSVLWLLEDNPTAARNLRKEAEARGIDSSRLVFARHMPLDEHLARHRLADLFIDTLPYNAHTTASDALWAGLPVLTCMGRSFASRVAASLLKAIELPELVTNTQAEFEARAIELAKNPDKLREIKSRLEKNRMTTPLFDAKLFSRHIESAYEAMFARYQAGLPPASIDVQP